MFQPFVFSSLFLRQYRVPRRGRYTAAVLIAACCQLAPPKPQHHCPRALAPARRQACPERIACRFIHKRSCSATIRPWREEAFVAKAEYERDRYEPRRDADDAAGSYDPALRATENRPPSFKWIHVGALDGDARSLGEGTPSEDGARLSNYLSVRTHITIDGAPMDAFGKACIQGDGTWRLIPDEPAEY